MADVAIKKGGVKMIKTITLITSNSVSIAADNYVRTRILSAYLAFMVAATSAKYKSAEAVDYFEALNKSVSNSHMTGDMIVANYAQKCIAALNTM